MSKEDGNTNEAGDPDEYNDPDEDLEETQMNDSPGQAVFRYLQLLTAWVTAAKVVPPRLRKLGGDPISRLDVTCVTLEDGSQEAYKDAQVHVRVVAEDLKRLANESTTDPQTLEHVCEWIDIHCKMPEQQRPIRVHAEAGLMALLQRLRASSEDADELVAMLGTLRGVRIFASAASVRAFTANRSLGG